MTTSKQSNIHFSINKINISLYTVQTNIYTYKPCNLQVSLLTNSYKNRKHKERERFTCFKLRSPFLKIPRKIEHHTHKKEKTTHATRIARVCPLHCLHLSMVSHYLTCPTLCEKSLINGSIVLMRHVLHCWGCQDCTSKCFKCMLFTADLLKGFDYMKDGFTRKNMSCI